MNCVRCCLPSAWALASLWSTMYVSTCTCSAISNAKFIYVINRYIYTYSYISYIIYLLSMFVYMYYTYTPDTSQCHQARAWFSCIASWKAYGHAFTCWEGCGSLKFNAGCWGRDHSPHLELNLSNDTVMFRGWPVWIESNNLALSNGMEVIFYHLREGVSPW